MNLNNLALCDSDFNIKYIIDEYDSVLWASRFYDSGEFVIITTEKFLQYYKTGDYITRGENLDAGFIEDIRIEITEDNNKRVIVTGCSLLGLTKYRIIDNQIIYNNNISWVITNLLNNHLIAPTDSKRKIKNWNVINTSITENVQIQFTGDNLLSAMKDILTPRGYGFKLYHRGANVFFEIKKSDVRTINNGNNPPIIFSPLLDNLAPNSFSIVSSNSISDIQVAGSGEGNNRIKVWTGLNKTGTERREKFYDLRNTDNTTPNYTEELRQLGKGEVIPITQEVDATAIFGGGIKYNETVFLGDIVTLNVPEWGINKNVKIIEVVETLDRTDGYKISPIFDEV